MTARSFRLVLVLKCFAWRQTAEVVSLSVCAQRRCLAQVKDRVLRTLFFTWSGAPEKSPGL